TSHLHLPVQSGSNRVLRRMKRFYTRQHFLTVVDKLRRVRPDITITTDFIVGFPGEGGEDFEQTLQLMDEADIVGSFSFKYSPRPGTPALRLKDLIPNEISAKRLTILQYKQRERSTAWVASHIGRQVSVLVDGPSRHDEGVICGRTSTNLTVNFPGTVDLMGRIVDVQVTRGFTHSCRGELV
ncbi:MAG: radical SAM protein, partial [Proteobacteria bacterium]|nr:radical SAM protein [Pseudomonadota bacterium]